MLRAIVHLHVETSGPVGSLALTTRFNLSVSPATVRNVMADLERRGLIAQPHTSAGRVPTDLGYREYVNDLMPPPRLQDGEQARIAATIRRQGLLQERLGALASVLAHLAPYTAIIQLPADATLSIREVHLVAEPLDRAIAVVVSCEGLVRHRVVSLKAGAEKPTLDRMSRFLTEHLREVTLAEAPQRLESLRTRDGEEERLRDHGLHVARQLLVADGQSEILLDGAAHIMEQPEFRDRETVRGLLELLDERGVLNRWLDDEPPLPESEGGLRFHIGAENPLEEAQACTLAKIPFAIGHARGRLALLGPTRMQYRQAAALLTYAGEHLSASLGLYAA